MESPKKQKPPLPEKQYVYETFRVEPLITKSENSKTDGQAQPSSLQLITPPPAYQCLGAQHLPSAPQLQQQTSQFHDKIPPNELPQPATKQPTPYKIPQPTTINQNSLITTVKLMGTRNPPPLDFDQLKITANRMHNRCHSYDIINNEDQPRTNEVTYYDTHSLDTYEI